LILCSVGGLAVGADLLRLCAAAYPHILEHVKEARMVLVCGPLELTALRRPFVYFSLEGQVEQTLTVAGRLARQGAGERRDNRTTTPEAVADAVTRLLPTVPAWPSIPADGAKRAAELIATHLVPNPPSERVEAWPIGAPC